MAHSFSRGLDPIPAKAATVETAPRKTAVSEEFLILLLLFVLLAASPSMGVNSSYFFIIIMAVIGLGGVDKAFGLNR
jgi:hypothetical protein